MRVLVRFSLFLLASTAVLAQTQTPSTERVSGVLYADQFPGSDIGEKVNAAIAALPLIPVVYARDTPQHCGTIQIPIGKYTQSTTIIKPNCVTIEGNGAQLVYTGTSYSIIEAGPYLMGMTFDNIVGGVHNLWMNGGANLTAGTTKSSGYVGLLLGGDPSGATPGNYGAFGQNNVDLHIEGFQTGVLIGRYSSLDTFTGGTINSNGTGVWYPGNAYGSGEAYTFLGTQINNNYTQGILDDGCGEIRMHGGSIDYTGGVPGQPFYTGNKYAVTGACVDFQAYGTHFEQDGAPILNVTTGSVSLYGGELYASSTAAPASSYVITNGTNTAYQSYGTRYFARHTMHSDVQWNSTGTTGVLHIHGVGDSSVIAPVTGVNLAAIADCDVYLRNKQYCMTNATYTGLITAAGGLQATSTPTDLNANRQGLMLGFNYLPGTGTGAFLNNANTGTVGGFNFYEADAGATPRKIGQITKTGLVEGNNGVGITTSGVTWTSGAAAPPSTTGACVTGSLYSNTVGTTGSILWVCTGTSWVAVK